MQIKLAISLVAATTVIAFMLGYNISQQTGVEPGFFERAEAGGYGAGTESKAPEGLSSDLQKHYSNLSADED